MDRGSLNVQIPYGNDFLYTIAGPVVTMGSAADNDIQLEDSTVSLHHARLEVLESGTLTIEDFGSTQNTLVNGRAITPNVAVRLSGGETIQLGQVQLRYVPPKPTQAPPVAVGPPLTIVPERPLRTVSPGELALYAVRPGSAEALAMTVRSNVAERLDVQISFVGSGSEWVRAVPSSLTLAPNDWQDVAVQVEAPAGYRSPAGLHPLGVRVSVPGNPGLSITTTVLLDVAATSSLGLKVVPPGADGRGELVLSNDGNHTVLADLAARAYGDREASCELAQPTVLIAPCQVAKVAITVASQSRPLMRPSAAQQLEVTAMPRNGGEGALIADEFVLAPLISSRVLVVAAVVGAFAFGLIWLLAH